MLIWSDRTNFGATHDDETREYFRNTKVHCAMVPRRMDTSEFTDVLQNQFSSTTYSHHQKSIICDRQLPNEARRGLVAFVGGLDLTDGRWDTPGIQISCPKVKNYLIRICNGRS